MANAKVQIQRKSKEYGGDKYFIYLPVDLVSHLEISAGHRVGFKMENYGQDKNNRKSIPFKKKEPEQI